MNIRSFCSNDWEEMFRIYNSVFTADQVDELFFVHHLLLNPNFKPEGTFILEDNGKIVAWTTVLTTEKNLNCWSNIAENGRGIAHIMPPAALDLQTTLLLIDTAEKYARKIGCTRCRCGIPGYTLFPNGIAEDDYPMLHEAFVKSGFYITGNSYSMQRSLENYTIPQEHQQKIDELASMGITIKTGDVYDLVPLRNMFENSSLRNWMHLVDRKAEQHKLHEMIVVRQGDQAIGYCQYNYFDMIDRAGPFGITDSIRGKGIGTAMIAKLFEAMAQNNLRRAWFASCVKERINFYQKNGLQVYRQKSIFYKDL